MSVSRVENRDCLEAMKEFPDKYIDLTVTSPPYDSLRTYNGNIDQWNFDKFTKIADELYRITKDGGVVVWIVNDGTIDGSESGTSFRQALYFKDIGFNIHDTMIWQKDAFAFPDPTRYGQTFEYMFVLSKGKPKTVNKICDRRNKFAGTKIRGTNRKPDGTLIRKSGDIKNNQVKEIGERFNVWSIPSEKRNNTGHPAVFPRQIAYDHIVSWSNKGDLVLDCFMGSGTTGIACQELERDFIGIELDKNYFEIASKRIEDAKNDVIIQQTRMEI